ncbi:MAG: hypothetical protein ACK5LR_04240 [Mangrovibacterium sp.]
MKNYLSRMSLLTAALLLANHALDAYLLPELSLRFGDWVVVLFFVITVATHKVELVLLEKQTQRFPLWHQVCALAKMLIYFGVAIGCILAKQVEGTPFLIYFAVCYLVYLVAETISMQRIVRTYQTKATK